MSEAMETEIKRERMKTAAAEKTEIENREKYTKHIYLAFI